MPRALRGFLLSGRIPTAMTSGLEGCGSGFGHGLILLA
jgi:hypothetical protein